MKRHIALVMVLGLALFGMAPAYAGTMVLEANPKVNAAAADLCDIFYVCSMWHEVSPVWCTDWHVVYCGPALPQHEASVQGINNVIDKKPAGRQLILENESGTRKVQIDRIAPQYHLASGAIVSPSGTWSARDANGEEWTEVRSYLKLRLGVSNWEDSNRDGKVGVGDNVVFDNGTSSTIKSVRLGVHVSDIPSNKL